MFIGLQDKLQQLELYGSIQPEQYPNYLQTTGRFINQLDLQTLPELVFRLSNKFKVQVPSKKDS